MDVQAVGSFDRPYPLVVHDLTRAAVRPEIKSPSPGANAQGPKSDADDSDQPAAAIPTISVVEPTDSESAEPAPSLDGGISVSIREGTHGEAVYEFVDEAGEVVYSLPPEGLLDLVKSAIDVRSGQGE